MTAGELVVMFAATLGGVAVTGMLIAVLLIWFRHAMKQVALLLAGVGAFVLLLTLLTRLSSDALAMLVGGVVFMLCSIPALLIVRAGADPHSRAHAREHWGLDSEYDKVDAWQPAAWLDADDSEVVTVERANHKQLTGGHNERR